jgi:hypothetical protein
MAEYDIDFDDDLDNDDEGDMFEDSRQSSSLVRKLRKELNATKKQLKERESEFSRLSAETRSRTIKDVLSSAGANPKIAAFIPSDIDPTEDAVSAWLNEYGDVFGFQSETAQSPVGVDVDAVGRMGAVEARGVAVDAMGDLADRIANASSREELQALLRNA